MPYGAPTDAVPVRLNVNENPYEPPADVVAAIAEAVRAALDDANRYPDREALQLRAALAEYVGQRGHRRRRSGPPTAATR